MVLLTTNDIAKSLKIKIIQGVCSLGLVQLALFMVSYIQNTVQISTNSCNIPDNKCPKRWELERRYLNCEIYPLCNFNRSLDRTPTVFATASAHAAKWTSKVAAFT